MADKKGGGGGKKKKIDLTIKAEEFRQYDLKKEALDALMAVKKLDPIKFAPKEEYDEDDFTEAELKKSAMEFCGLAVKLLDQHVKDTKRYTPEKAWKEFVDLVEKKTLKAWVKKEVTKSDSGGSGGKKEGAAAVKAIGDVDFSKFPKQTREEAIAALEPFTKSDAKPDEKAVEEAVEGIGQALKSFDEVWSPAFDAKNAIEDAAKKTKPDKKDKAMMAFGKQTKGLVKEVDKNLEKIRPVLLALFAAQDELKKKTPDAKKLNGIAEQFAKLKSADSAGAQLAKQMGQFVKAFEKVEGSFA